MNEQQNNKMQSKFRISIIVIVLGILGLLALYKVLAPKTEQLTTTQTTRNTTETIPIGLPFTNHFAQIPLSTEENYVIPNYLKPDYFALEGQWIFTDSAVRLVGETGKLKLNFKAKKVYLSAGADKETSIQVKADSENPQVLSVQKPDRYLIFDNPNPSEHVLEITVPYQNLEVYQFDFE